MKLKESLKRIIRFGHNSPEKNNHYLTLIRNFEWDAIKQYIPIKSKFLDIGCGAGYSMRKAIEDRDCLTTGIDPQPSLAGVKFEDFDKDKFSIIQGFAEQMPFDNCSFDVVYSSHVFEHVNNYQQTLNEMNRVLKDNGVMILGVPTSTLAWLGLFAQILYTTHIRIAKYIIGLFKKKSEIKLVNIFLPRSHSEINKTVLYDLKNYKISVWREKVSTVFDIVEEIKPALFCFSDFKPFFRIRKHNKYSSSVFFICKKRL